MKLFEPVSLGTNLMLGYSVPEALSLVKESGFDFAELSSIVNMCEHVDPKRIDEEYALYFQKELHQAGLQCYAISGHVDLTEERQLQDFLKKIEFAGRLGAKIVNTNSGPLSRLEAFHENMKRVIAAAEKWNVVIGLESHGDIVGTAKGSMGIFQKYNHPLVRFNYDTGNTLFYEAGNIRVEEDILYGLEYLSYIHLKDIRIRGDRVQYCPIGEGDVNFEKFFRVLKDWGKPIPCGVEIPTHVQGVLGNIGPKGTPMPREAILRDARASRKAIEALL